jgi:hypothetical protein
MRLDGVEIKVSFGSDQTGSAMQALSLPSSQPRWQIFFCEDVNPGVLPGTPLLDGGVVLRARLRSGDDADATVKLRPCRGSQLIDRWLTETDKLKVEADWAGQRKVLAASHTDNRPKQVISDVARGRRSVTDLFTKQQLQFLSDCAGIQVNLDTLTALPPVTAMRWKTVATAPPDLSLRAERWTVGDLDFLELSIAVQIEQAPAKQAALTDFVGSLGLTVNPEQETKTRQVLDHLVRASLALD